MSVPTAKWIEFKRREDLERGRTTQVWVVTPKASDAVLGHVAWYGKFRSYSFYPEADTVYEPRCMNDIAAFIRWLMDARRAG